MASPGRASVALAGVALAGFLALSQTPALATSGARADAPNQIVLSGTVVVPRGADVGEVVVVHGSARVDGVAHGDVVVLDGPVLVRGQVSGSVIAVDGRVALGDGAQVLGDVTARGAVTLADDVEVGGRVRQHVAYAWRTPIDVFGRFASWLAVSVSTLLFGLLVVLLAPRGLDAAAAVARTSPWPAAGWGLAAAVGIPAAVLLAVASLVALPLGLVTLLALALLAFVGYVLAAYALGRALLPSPRTRAASLAVGWLVLRMVAAVPFVSGMTFALAAAFGLGAGIVATWRARATAGRHRGRRRTEVALGAPLREEAGL